MANVYRIAAHLLLVFVLVNGHPLQKHREKRIVGGTPVTKPGKWPWIATLVFNQTHYCSGSIIDKKWIVTTAHCFHDNHSSTKARDWLVKVGKHDISKQESHEQSLKVKRIIRHPNYTNMWDKFKIDRPDDNDVALLEFLGHINYTSYAKPIRLLGDGTRFRPGHKCNIAGWGHTHFEGKTQDILREVAVELVSRKKCNSPISYNGTVHNRAICAGYEGGGRDACQYDSGGPLFCRKAGRWYLVGQVSWGDKCGLPHKYGVYSNMQRLTPWVKSIIKTPRNIRNRHG
ncbi:transmembrane protease serine 11D-like [Paramuricea clavata]|uniref:Transmembrane protease serine 11D-like n=1 Tax=Paramuricea clavata TaxID=317549 RepID=A0A6S7H0E4_PARCT|nr:transmembrane protease serine 11D-like [Paramuricea clavata]